MITQVLQAILPGPEQTLLLRASLLKGDECRQAWDAWKKIAGDAKQAMAADRWSVKRLLPPLYVALREAKAEVDAQLVPYLKLAYVREQMRSRTYVRIAGEVLNALQSADIPVIALRGAALAATVYPDAALRHCHDIALLIPEAQITRAKAVVLATGRAIIPWDASEGGPVAIFRDETMLPIELYTRLLNLPYYRLTWADASSRTRAATIGGVNTRILSAEDALLHVCVHASYSKSRDSLRWVGDAWHLIRANRINWKAVVDGAYSSRTSLPLVVTLRYLVERLGAPIPADVISQLDSLAELNGAIARDVALHGARVGECESLSGLFRRMPSSHSLSLRLATIKWLLLPSPQYVTEVVGARGAGSMFAHYVRRPLAYARRFVTAKT